MELLGFELPVYLVLLPLAAVLLYVFSTWPFSQLKELGLKGPPPRPFVGNQWQLESKGVYYALQEWSKTYGRTYGIYMFRKPLIVTSDCDILKEVMVKDFGHFTNRWNQNATVMSSVLKKGVFFAEGSDWKRIRNIITPSFSAGKLKMMEHFINTCSADLVENLTKIAENGGKVDVKEYFGAYTLDVITGTAFGLRVNTQKDLNEPFVNSIKSMFKNNIRRNPFIFLFRFFPFLGPVVKVIRNSRLFRASGVSFMFDNIEEMVKQRRQDKDQKRPVDFLQLLINAESNEEHGHKSLTQDEIAGQVFIFFIAGYETTATTLQYLAYNLALHPDVQEAVVQEINQQLGDKEEPNYENVGRLKYMEQVINETLRLFPPVTMVTRLASKTVTIKGVTIPKDTAVLIPICDVLKDPEHFPNPEVFNPDRFSSDQKNSIPPIAFLPFGFGPRLCIGMRLAMMEIKIAMVHVLRKIQFVRTPDLPEKIKFKDIGGLLPPSEPIMVKAVLRKQ